MMDPPVPSAPSAASFEALAASSADGICTADRHGTVTFVNETLARMVDMPAADVVGRSIFDFLVDDVRAAWDELAASPSSLPDLAEFELRGRDGTTVPVLLSITALGDDHFEGVLAVVRDISDRRRTEAALAEREAMLSALVANVPGMVYRCERTAGWPMRFVSDEVHRLIGWSQEEVLADPFLYGTRIHPQDVAAIEAAIDAAGSGPFAVRYRLIHRDGSTRWVWERGRTTVPATATTAAVLEGIVVDITRQVHNERSLAESEDRYRTLIEALPGGVLVTREERVLFASATAARLLGVDPADLQDRPILSLLSPADGPQLGEGADLAETTVVGNVRTRYQLRVGSSLRILAALSSPTTFEGLPATQTFLWDVTEEERTASLQAAQEPVLEALAAGAPLVEVLTVTARAMELVLPGRLCGIVLMEDGGTAVVVGESLPERTRRALVEEHRDAGEIPWSVAMATGERLVVDDLTAGHWAPALQSACAVDGLSSCWTAPAGTGGGRHQAAVLVFGRTAGPTAPEEQIFHEHFRRLVGLVLEHSRASHFGDDEDDVDVDPATGLFTRTHVLQVLDEALAARRTVLPGSAGGSVAVLLVSIDDVAQLADALGAEVTDEIIRAVASLLEVSVGEEDIVARSGPSTFLVATTADYDVDLDRLAGRLQAAIAAPFRIGSREVFVTASVGVAMSLDARDTGSTLVADADVALHQAMRAGPAGQRRFDDRLRQQQNRRVQLEPALARAVDAGEFRVLYQPQVDLGTGAVVGAEALVRWAHPTEGMVSPVEFIPMAERNGLIVPIGSWVLGEACRRAAAWCELRAEQPPFVSVNLSARQLADPDLIHRVEEALADSHLDPALLRLELTETAVMSDPASATVILRRLRTLGVRLSIDDFGTGYSSMVYLKRFPVDELKIDRAFVDGVGERTDDTAIVAAIVNLAHSLGLSALAEGVERPAQARELLRLGCTVGQGFLWAHALEADDLAATLLTGFPSPAPPAPVEATPSSG